MLEIVVSGLFLAVISAVVLVAYRHPGAFAKLHASVKRPLGWAAFGTLAFAIGDSEVRGTVFRALPTVLPNNDQASSALRALLADTPPFGWILLGLGGVWCFLEALSALPRLGIVDASGGTAPPAQPPGQDTV